AGGRPGALPGPAADRAGRHFQPPPLVPGAAGRGRRPLRGHPEGARARGRRAGAGPGGVSAGAGAGSAFVPRGAATMCGSPRTQAEERVGSDDDRMEGHRLHWARCCAACALWCLPALALTLPKGLLPFGLLLLVSTLLVPGVVAGARRIGWPLAAVAATALLSMSVALLSSHWAGGGGIESRD